jgi:hypothetical protein
MSMPHPVAAAVVAVLDRQLCQHVPAAVAAVAVLQCRAHSA